MQRPSDTLKRALRALAAGLPWAAVVSAFVTQDPTRPVVVMVPIELA